MIRIEDSAVIGAVSLGRILVDSVPVGLAVSALVSIAIWEGLAQAATPTLLVQRLRRTWTRRARSIATA